MSSPKLYMIKKMDWEDNELFSTVKINRHKEEIFEYIKEIETDGEPFKAYEVDKRTMLNTSPLEYLNLFDEYGFFVEKHTEKVENTYATGWDVKFPTKAHTYIVRPLLFADYNIQVSNKYPI